MNDKLNFANPEDDPWLRLMLTPHHDYSPGGTGSESLQAKADSRSPGGKAMNEVGGGVREGTFTEIWWLRCPQAEVADPTQTVERRATAAAVNGAIRSLPQEQRMLLRLTVYEGKPINAVARLLGMESQSARQYLSWARVALARVLQEWI